MAVEAHAAKPFDPRFLHTYDSHRPTDTWRVDNNDARFRRMPLRETGDLAASLENKTFNLPNMTVSMFQLPWAEVAGAGLTIVGTKRKNRPMLVAGMFIGTSFSLNSEAASKALLDACSPQVVQPSPTRELPGPIVTIESVTPGVVSTETPVRPPDFTSSHPDYNNPSSLGGLSFESGFYQEQLPQDSAFNPIIDAIKAEVNGEQNAKVFQRNDNQRNFVLLSRVNGQVTEVAVLAAGSDNFSYHPNAGWFESEQPQAVYSWVALPSGATMDNVVGSYIGEYPIWGVMQNGAMQVFAPGTRGEFVSTSPSGVAPEPTHIVETVNSIRAAEVAISNNWNPNDERTWASIPADASPQIQEHLQNMRDVNADPNAHLNELEQYDNFLYQLRVEHLAHVLLVDRTALDLALSTGYVDVAVSDADLSSYFQNESTLKEWLNSFSKDHISNIENVWCNINNTEFMPSHVELKQWLKGYSAGIQNKDLWYSTSVDKNNTVTGKGYYGMWNSSSYDERNIWAEVNTPITVFGEEIKLSGNWGPDWAAMDYGAKLNLPYGRVGGMGIFQVNNRIYKMPFVVVTDENLNVPASIAKFPNDNFSGFELLGVPVRSRQHISNNNNIPLTGQFLRDKLQWPPPLLILQSSDEHLEQRGLTHMLFDEQTGLPIAAGSDYWDGELERAGIEITDVINAWP